MARQARLRPAQPHADPIRAHRAEAAHEILRQAGISNVSIVERDELLGDHYDPKHKRKAA